MLSHTGTTRKPTPRAENTETRDHVKGIDLVYNSVVGSALSNAGKMLDLEICKEGQQEICREGGCNLRTQICKRTRMHCFI